MIRVQSLMKSFHDPKRGTVMAVDGISFEARAGEIFGLLGSNGAGKTTTMRMLATILKPTGGSAEVAGYDIVKSAPDVRRSIGFLSGDMGYYHRLSPREVLNIFGQLNGLSGSALRDRVELLITEFEMTAYADARADTFSTGMRQRANVARVLVHDPPVLILDEPTSGLDVPTAQIIEQFIVRAKTQGKCVVLSTHIMEEAEYLCDRIAVVHGGKLQALGTMDELRLQTGKQRLREVFLALIHSSSDTAKVVA
ncbi:MAG: ATP-binding cassette domain-containing protein [Bryobacteraceae bacterium]|nr:ATP-binding cassette domain-containing protein [Bryobacteraceae bacterium]